MTVSCNNTGSTAGLPLHQPEGVLAAASPVRAPCVRALLLQAFALPLIMSCGNGIATTSDSARGDSSKTTADNAGRASRAPLELPVVAERARDGDLVLRVNTTGLIRSDATVRLTSEVGGVVTAVHARAGARVVRGQPIITLDAFPFDLAVREAQASVDEADQRFLESFVPESLVTGRGPTAEQRRALMNKAGLVGARLRLERARWEQARATITSPVDGAVDAVTVAVGERTDAGQGVATVVDTKNLRVEAQVLEHDLSLIRAGGEALITSSGAPGQRIHGRIEAVLPLVDSISRAGRAVVRVSGNGALRPGMYADVQLEAARLTGRRLVPTRAVIERDGRPLVFVVRDGRAQWTYINPGRSNGIDTEVLPDSVSGLVPVKAGDQVIVEGHLTLTHDAPVKLTAVRDRTDASSVQPASASRVHP